MHNMRDDLTFTSEPSVESVVFSSLRAAKRLPAAVTLYRGLWIRWLDLRRAKTAPFEPRIWPCRMLLNTAEGATKSTIIVNTAVLFRCNCQYISSTMTHNSEVHMRVQSKSDHDCNVPISGKCNYNISLYLYLSLILLREKEKFSVSLSLSFSISLLLYILYYYSRTPI
eukprot:sb/3472293/